MNKNEHLSDNGPEESLFPVYLPYSHMKDFIPKGTVYEDVMRNTQFLRLHDIRILSFLSYHEPQFTPDNFVQFFHNRLGHSLAVALTTEHILRQNGFPQERVNIGIIAGLIHDIATPALGDATKKVDRENLDEEEHWAEIMGEEGIELLERYGTNEPEIDSIIKNQGVLGQVLDIADRITYVTRDTYAIIGPIGKTGFMNKNPTYANFYASIEEFVDILNRFPEIGNIYQDVRVDQGNGQVFFDNPSQLEAFLHLRTLLHQKLYIQPISQARDLFIGKLLESMYSTTDPQKLNPSLLRKMTDHELLQVIGKKYFPSKPNIIFSFPDLVNWHPKFEKFEKEEEAEARAQQLRQDNNIAVIGVQKSSGFDPATKYKVKDGNRTVEFREYNPSGARRIEKIAESTKGIFLFYADVSTDSPTNTLLRKVLKP